MMLFDCFQLKAIHYQFIDLIIGYYFLKNFNLKLHKYSYRVMKTPLYDKLAI